MDNEIRLQSGTTIRVQTVFPSRIRLRIPGMASSISLSQPDTFLLARWLNEAACEIHNQTLDNHHLEQLKKDHHKLVSEITSMSYKLQDMQNKLEKMGKRFALSSY